MCVFNFQDEQEDPQRATFTTCSCHALAQPKGTLVAFVTIY